MAAQIMRQNLQIGVRPLLGAISAPTLVVHGVGDPVVPIEGGRYLANHIDGAQMLELDGDFHASWRPEEVAGWRDAVIEFLTAGGAPAQAVDRVLATVLFTDIVSSTQRAAEMGDVAWRTVLDQHDRIVGAEIERFGGRLIKSTGDGVLATFDGPSRGIGCARAAVDALRAHDLPIRSEAHTGEVELRGDDVTKAARRFFDHALADHARPVGVITDKAPGAAGCR